MKKISDFLKKIFDKFLFNRKFMRATRVFHFQKNFPDELIIKKSDKCLVLAPHPDDESFGCGGIMAKYPENFSVVCVSDGSRGSYGVEPEVLKETRKQEFIAAMTSLNINEYSFLDIPDNKIIHNYNDFKALNVKNYDYIFIPNYFDEHKDHKTLTVFLQKMIKERKTKSDLKIVFYEVWAALPLISHFVDISDTIEKKKELIEIFKSQTQYVDFLGGILGLNKYRGMLTNRKYSEGFVVLDIKDFLKF